MLKDCHHQPIDNSRICAICPKPDDWQTHARCLDHDPDLWYVGEDQPVEINRAIRICMDCPVRGFCLEEGWKNKWGIWGSFTASQRERMRKQFPLPKIATHRRKIIRIIAHKL